MSKTHKKPKIATKQQENPEPQAIHSQKGVIHAKATKSIKKQHVWEFPLTKKSFIWAGIGLGAIVLGYLLMATGITQDAATLDGRWNNTFAVNIAPFVLVLGYCVLIPMALMKSFSKKEEIEEPEE